MEKELKKLYKKFKNIISVDNLLETIDDPKEFPELYKTFFSRDPDEIANEWRRRKALEFIRNQYQKFILSLEVSEEYIQSIPAIFVKGITEIKEEGNGAYVLGTASEQRKTIIESGSRFSYLQVLQDTIDHIKGTYLNKLAIFKELEGVVDLTTINDLEEWIEEQMNKKKNVKREAEMILGR